MEGHCTVAQLCDYRHRAHPTKGAFAVTGPTRPEDGSSVTGSGTPDDVPAAGGLVDHGELHRHVAAAVEKALHNHLGTHLARIEHTVAGRVSDAVTTGRRHVNDAVASGRRHLDHAV